MSFSTQYQSQKFLDEAEDYFKRGDLEKAMELATAAGNLKYFVAYLIHKAVALNRNYYRLLKISDPFADHKTVRKAYKHMALLLHPDKNKSAAADGAFKIVTGAWSVLSDPVRRKAYNTAIGLVEKDPPVPRHLAAEGWKRVKIVNSGTPPPDLAAEGWKKVKIVERGTAPFSNGNGKKTGSKSSHEKEQTPLKRDREELNNRQAKSNGREQTQLKRSREDFKGYRKCLEVNPIGGSKGKDQMPINSNGIGTKVNRESQNSRQKPLGRCREGLEVNGDEGVSFTAAKMTNPEGRTQTPLA